MSFIQRKIKVVFSYGTGMNGDGPPRVYQITDHRTICMAEVTGDLGMGQLNLRIYGLSDSLMNELAQVGKTPQVFRRNSVVVSAGNDVDGLSQVYAGTIIQAYADFGGMPEVCFNVTASVGGIHAAIPISALSYPGNADAAVILGFLAKIMQVGFEPNGVSVILRDRYYKGTALEQVKACIRDANVEWNGLENNILAVWPKHSMRPGRISLISPETGLVGYPTYNALGMTLTTVYNPAIRFGTLVEVDSHLPVPGGMVEMIKNNQYKVIKMNHGLMSEVPGGAWFTQLTLVIPGLVVSGK